MSYKGRTSDLTDSPDQWPECPDTEALLGYSSACLPDDELSLIDNHVRRCRHCALIIRFSMKAVQFPPTLDASPSKASSDGMAARNQESVTSGARTRPTLVKLTREGFSHRSSDSALRRTPSLSETEAWPPYADRVTYAIGSGSDSLKSRYRIMSEIGRGGMGTVYKAWDRRLRRYVAMKLFDIRNESKGESTISQSSPVEDDVVRARFLNEALFMSQFSHPGIVPVHDIGLNDEGRVYFTMRLIKGKTLRSVFSDIHAGYGKTVRRSDIRTILSVCEAVAYAHSKHVIHRDIKPDNVMVEYAGGTYLMDWGLACETPSPRGLSSREGAIFTSRDSLPSDAGDFGRGRNEPIPSLRNTEPSTGLPVTLNTHNRLLGTPVYMSPEQAWGDYSVVDERTDVYSLGAMIYHLISGQMPYVEPGTRPFPVEVVMYLRRGPPKSIREIAPHAPLPLIEICENAMARNLSSRYASVHEIVLALQDYLDGVSRPSSSNLLGSSPVVNRSGRSETIECAATQSAGDVPDGTTGVPAEMGQLVNSVSPLARESLEERLMTFVRSQLGPESERLLGKPGELPAVVAEVRAGREMSDAVLARIHAHLAGNRQLADEFAGFFLFDLMRIGRLSMSTSSKLRRFLDTGDLVLSVFGDLWCDVSTIRFESTLQFKTVFAQRMNWKTIDQARRLDSGVGRADRRVVESVTDLCLPKNHSENTPLPMEIRTEERERMILLLLRLDDRERRLLSLRLKGMSLEDTSSTVGLSLDTTRKALDRAIAKARHMAVTDAARRNHL